MLFLTPLKSHLGVWLRVHMESKCCSLAKMRPFCAFTDLKASHELIRSHGGICPQIGIARRATRNSIGSKSLNDQLVRRGWSQCRGSVDDRDMLRASLGSSAPSVRSPWRAHDQLVDGLKSRVDRKQCECRCISSYSHESDQPRESRFYAQELERKEQEQIQIQKYGRHKWKRKKPSKRRPSKPSPRNYKANKEGYKDLVFKWFMQAYPESLSRQEVAGRLRAHPKKVKGLIIKSLVKDGKLLKWGQRSAPYERYIPVIKAPEYYEVTGEEPPLMPDIDEVTLISPEKFQKYLAQPEEGPRPPASQPGFQDHWDEGGKLDDMEVQKLQDITELQGWDELFEDPSDEEESEEEQDEEEAVLLKRMKLSREREQRRARGVEVDSDENESETDEEDESASENNGEGVTGTDESTKYTPTPNYSEMLAGSFEGLNLDSSGSPSSFTDLQVSDSKSDERLSSEELSKTSSYSEDSVDSSVAKTDGSDLVESLPTTSAESQNLDHASPPSAAEISSESVHSAISSESAQDPASSSGPYDQSHSHREESEDDLDYASSDDGEFLDDDENDEIGVPSNQWDR